MATKAVLEAELIQLRAQLADQKRSAASTDTEVNSRSEVIAETPESTEAPHDEAQEVLNRLVAENSLGSGDIQAVMEKLSDELGDFPHKKPLLTALAAFALGVVVGRMTK
jgi:hypothetical protein